MFTLIDTETKDRLGQFDHENYARICGRYLSQATRRPITLLDHDASPLARYFDGKDISVKATVHYLE